MVKLKILKLCHCNLEVKPYSSYTNMLLVLIKPTFLFSAVPSAPVNPHVKDVETRAVTLKWSPPAKDGGSPVTGYTIEYRVSGMFRWDVANHGEPIMDQRYTVRNLKDGESYEFRIAAVNKAGTGTFAPVDMIVAVKEPIG